MSKKPVRAPAPPPKPTAKARKLARELHEAQLEARTIRARQALRRLKESSALDYDWVSPWQALLSQRVDGDPNFFPVGAAGMRGRHGAQFPFYQTETQLAMLRDLSRIVAATNTNAGGLLRGYTSFVIGTGFATKVSARTGTGGAGAAAAARVTQFLDRWSKLNNWPERQQELARRTERDGDGILRLFPHDGWLKCRFVWPEQVTQPPGESAEEWSFGVKWACNDDGEPDEETLEAVYVASNRVDGTGDYVPAEDVVLFQPENDSGVKRRLPLFAFGMREALDTAHRLTRNLGEGAAVRAAIAYMRKHAGAGESDVEAANFDDADFRERAPLGDTQRPVNVSFPGMVIDFAEGTEHVPQPVASDTAANSAVVDLLVRAACAKINAPEWLGSSNAANMGAYTSSLVAESPFVKGVVQTQGYYKQRFLRVIDRALEVAAAHGVIDRADLDLVAVDLVPPSPEVRNKLEESQRAQIEIPLGVDSRQRYCESQDRDYERVAQENREYAEKTQQQPGGAQPTPEVQAPAPPPDPLAALTESVRADGTGRDLLEDVGVTADGELWLSDRVYRQLLEADRAGLVLKDVTDKNGNTVKRWVKQGTAAGADDQAKTAADPADTRAVAKALRDPAGLTADDVRALAEHARGLPKEQLRQLALAFRQKIGGTRAALADRLLEHVRRAGEGKPDDKKPDPKPDDKKPDAPALPEPDYRQRDANDPVAKEILADTRARAALDRVRGKVAALGPARRARFDAELKANAKRNAWVNTPEPGPYKKSKAWQAKFDAKRKAAEEYREAAEEHQRAEAAERAAHAAVREEVVAALAHDTRSELTEAWHDDTADTPYGTVALPKTEHTQKVIGDAKAFVTATCANLGAMPVSYGVATSGRAFARKGAVNAVAMSVEPGTAAADAKGYSVAYATQVQVHELGHVIEFHKPGVKDLVARFVEYRCKGEAPVSLKERFPHNSFDADERGRKDDFERAFGPGAGAYYVGKTYADGSTEVVSMGLEKLYSDPAGLVQNDPEYAQLIFKVLTM